MTSSKQDQNKTQSRKKISRGGYSVLPPSLRSLVLLHLVLQIKMLGTEGRFSIMDCYNKDKPMCQSNLFSKSLSLSLTHTSSPIKQAPKILLQGGKSIPFLHLLFPFPSISPTKKKTGEEKEGQISVRVG